MLVGFVGCATPSINSGDHPPKVLTRFDPIFPVDLLKQGASGDATVEFTVDSEGTVTNPKVFRATAPGFGQSCIECILKWKFAPGVKNGRAIDVRLRQDFAFENPHKTG